MRCIDCGAGLVLGGTGPKLRCAACAMVARADMSAEIAHTHSTRGVRTRKLAVACWCERTTVWVPQGDVLAGQTRSCGLPRCKAAA